MHILMPMRPNVDPNTLFEEGADEFYAGFMDERWERHHGDSNTDLNRMSGFGKISNFESLERLEKVFVSTRTKGFPVHITLNGNGYDDREQKYVLKLCERISKIGFDSIIIGDPPTIKLACEAGYKVTVSTIGGVYNSELAAYYKDLGAKRIILPRDLSLNEIQSIVSNNPLEYEVFLMQNGCKYSDSSCTCNHGAGINPTCSKLHSSIKQYISQRDTKEIECNNHLFEDVFHKPACGLCAIFRFLEMGISTVKIVGRANSTSDNIKAIKLVKSNIDIAMQSKTEEEYLASMIRPDNLRNCNSLNCYYPDAIF